LISKYIGLLKKKKIDYQNILIVSIRVYVKKSNKWILYLRIFFK